MKNEIIMELTDEEYTYLANCSFDDLNRWCNKWAMKWRNINE